jgi:hypothetical protein
LERETPIGHVSVSVGFGLLFSMDHLADGVELVLGEAAEVFFAEAAVTEQSGEDDG